MRMFGGVRGWRRREGACHAAGIELVVSRGGGIDERARQREW